MKFAARLAAAIAGVMAVAVLAPAALPLTPALSPQAGRGSTLVPLSPSRGEGRVRGRRSGGDAEADGGASQFTSSVNLVEVYATVTDRQGEPVTGLTAVAFEVFEEGRRQEVTVFTAGEMGLSVAVALDRSFSMAGERLTAMSRASEQFLLALRPADRAMLVGIGSRVEVLAPLAADRAAGLRALATLDAFGSTSLHDAIIRALDEIQSASGRRALVLLSDGVDRYSRASEADVLDRARRGDVLVYPIAIGKQRPPLFAELASNTGGRSFHVTDLKRLPDTLKSIASELRAQYLLGYTPSRPLSGTSEWRALRVTVRRPDVTVRARPGYWTGR